MDIVGEKISKMILQSKILYTHIDESMYFLINLKWDIWTHAVYLDLFK